MDTNEKGRALRDVPIPERVKIYKEKKAGATAKEIMAKYRLANLGVVHNLMSLTKPKSGEGKAAAKTATKSAGARGPGRPKGSRNKERATPFPTVHLDELERLRTENAVLRSILESVPQVKALLAAIVNG